MLLTSFDDEGEESTDWAKKNTQHSQIDRGSRKTLVANGDIENEMISC